MNEMKQYFVEAFHLLRDIVRTKRSILNSVFQMYIFLKEILNDYLNLISMG